MGRRTEPARRCADAGAREQEGRVRLPGDVPTSELLVRLAQEGSSDRVSLGEIVEGAGSRAYGFALLLFALPEAIPLPAMGLTAVVALPLIAISARMAILGTQRPLPEWLRRRSIRRELLRAAARKGAPMLERIERVARPRPRWRRVASADRLLGTVCLLLAIVIALPIPFGNILPAPCILAVAFGMLQRDGMIIVGALVASAVTVAGLAAAVLLTGGLVLDAAAPAFE